MTEHPLNLHEPEKLPASAVFAEVFGVTGVILGLVLVIGMAGAVLLKGVC